MRRALLFLGLCGVLAGGAGSAWADSVHFKRGSPTFVDNGRSLTEQVKLAGLGNGDLVVRLSAVGQPTAVCASPGGGNLAPGQNPAEVSVDSAQVSIPASQIKNGNVSFSITTEAAPAAIAGAPDCPNPNWTEIVTGMAFTSATLSIAQGDVQALVTGTICRFTPQTSDGAVPAATVSCH